MNTERQEDRQESRAVRERKALLALLRAGLWEREPEDLSCFPLSDKSWESVFRQARRQTVTGLTFVGLQHLADHLLPPETLLLRWAAETDAIERRNKKMNSAIEELYTMFRKRGLNPILQKGQGVARFYGNPLLRECGDIDLKFNSSRAWDLAIVLLRRQNVRFKKQADHGIFYRWNGVDVEHHRQLLDLYNPFHQSFVNRLENRHGYQLIALSAEPQADITVPSPFMDLLLLNLHILKHSLGRGIGLRQLCDMACACHRLHGEVDAQEMKMVCQKLGLDRWSKLLHAFLVDCLGLPVDKLPYPETAATAQPLSDIVWRGGNFGHYDAILEQNAYGWGRKWQTARSFGRNVRFAFHYAPKEAFWLFIQLLKGQCK